MCSKTCDPDQNYLNESCSPERIVSDSNCCLAVNSELPSSISFNSADSIDACPSCEEDTESERHKISTYDKAKRAAEYLARKTNHRPKIAIICGSGLGGIGELLTEADTIPYQSVPFLSSIGIEGHKGQFRIGRLNSVPVCCMQGRFHYYEGHDMEMVALPVRIFSLLEVQTIIVTNAAGGINDDYEAGDFMIIKDHFSFPVMAGLNPLRGPNEPRFGKRFPSLHPAYHPELARLFKVAAREANLLPFVREGVYAMVSGPSYETIAEIRALKRLGADAVGMSTIPEVISARHCGMKVFGLSLISNKCISDYESRQKPNHEEVLETGKRRAKDLEKLMMTFVPMVASHKDD